MVFGFLVLLQFQIAFSFFTVSDPNHYLFGTYSTSEFVAFGWSSFANVQIEGVFLDYDQLGLSLCNPLPEDVGKTLKGKLVSFLSPYGIR